MELPYESDAGFEPAGGIDRCVLEELEHRGARPAPRCSDAVFLRRSSIDLTGALPEPAEALAFQSDPRPDKRSVLIDRLLARDGYVDLFALRWGDALRVKAEYPIKLWPNGVQAYARWIHDAVRENLPYDRFARRLLTSSGSCFREAPVNFYRAVQDRTPAGLAAAFALTFLGARYERWPPDLQRGVAAFFSRVEYKPTEEWKEEIVLFDPAPAPPVEAVFPDGTPVTVPSGRDPRQVLADWLLAPENPFFAPAIANRVWAWIFGRGIVHEPDDMRPDNPPSNPALLAHLADLVVRSGYDLRHLVRKIATSRTYEGSPIPRGDPTLSETLFASYPVRRLDAEVLMDALCRFDGRGEDYVSIVPEPWTILRNTTRSITLTDGTVTSPFLEMFGRPSRDTGLFSERNDEPTDAQRLTLLNASDVEGRIERSPWLGRLIRAARRDPLSPIRPIYLALLSRDPTTWELAEAAAYFGSGGRSVKESVQDLAWALLNAKEFLYRH